MTEPTRHVTDPSGRRFGQAIVLYVVCLLLLLTAGLLAQAISLEIGLAFTLLVLVLAPAVIFVRMKGLRVGAGLRLKRVRPIVAVVSALVGIGAWSLAALGHELLSRIIGQPPDMGFQVTTFSQYLLMLLVAAALPGFCEECLFRGAIQGVLERRGPWFAIVVTALLFGLFHLDPWRILPAAFLGGVFGWLVVRTESIIPAIIAHCANNATSFTIGYLLREATEIPAWLFLTLGVVFAVSLFIAWRCTQQGEAELSAPLSVVPAGVSRLVAWGGGLFAVSVGGVIGGAALLLVSIVTTVEMNDDALLPDIKAGDQLVLIKNGSFAFDLEADDTVSFERDNATATRVVARIDGNDVYVRDGAHELRVARDDIIGKMVQVIPKQ